MNYNNKPQYMLIPALIVEFNKRFGYTLRRQINVDDIFTIHRQNKYSVQLGYIFGEIVVSEQSFRRYFQPSNKN